MREKQNFLFGCVCIGLATLIFSTMEVFLKLPAVDAPGFLRHQKFLPVPQPPLFLLLF